MTQETKKEENPLFKIARKKHNEQFLTWEFDFLHLTPENENTYILGFCAGVSHAASIWQIQIEALQKKVEELEKMQAPTLALQDENKIVLDEDNANTLHY